MSQQSTTSAHTPEETEYDIELDQVMKLYNEAIQKERYYILNTIFELDDNNVFSLHCGLSPARCFEPAVKLVNKLDVEGSYHISFNTFEWAALIGMLRSLKTSYFTEDVSRENSSSLNPQSTLECCESIKIILSTYESRKMLTLNKYSTTFYLTEHDVGEFIRMDPIITRRFEMLSKINFHLYYQNFLDSVNEMLFQSGYSLKADDVISVFCKISNTSLEIYCMTECLHYIKNKILNDLDRKKYF